MHKPACIFWANLNLTPFSLLAVFWDNLTPFLALGSHDMHLHCVGTAAPGTPTVVFMHGYSGQARGAMGRQAIHAPLSILQSP